MGEGSLDSGQFFLPYCKFYKKRSPWFCVAFDISFSGNLNHFMYGNNFHAAR